MSCRGASRARRSLRTPPWGLLAMLSVYRGEAREKRRTTEVQCSDEELALKELLRRGIKGMSEVVEGLPSARPRETVR